MLFKLKKSIPALAASSLLLLLFSCGGVTEEDMLGEWSLDVTSIDVDFGDNLSAQDKLTYMASKAALQSSSESQELEAMTFKFRKGGKLLIGNEEYSFDGKWKLKDENVTLYMEIMGVPIEITAQVELDGDILTATITGEEIIRRMKNSKDDLKEWIGIENDYNKFKGTKFSVSFTRK